MAAFVKDGLSSILESARETGDELEGMPTTQSMSRKNFFAFLLTLKLSAIFLVAGLFMAPIVCTHGIFLWPMIAIALFLMLVLVLGCLGHMLDNVCLCGCHLLGVFIAIVALLGFVIFGYVAVGGVDLGSRKVLEYRLEDYSGWLRDRVADPRYWAATSACIRDRNVCFAVKQPAAMVHGPKTGVFVLRQLSSYQGPAKERRIHAGLQQMSPIEYGCCKPPSSCAFTSVNGTTTPTSTPADPAVVTNGDCSRWSDDEETLCFRCDSCKASFLDDTKKAWNNFAWIPIIGFIMLIATYCWRME
ncbi:tetraspanin-3-like [Oryza brachyantha]|uniref:Uncharacterized protein n=1 Tax=Oryza brachyantha TaxID=4533 RepID=J3LUV7_ORYBR|nr:tetraspanin-3-like [Oryza brachyantha]